MPDAGIHRGQRHVVARIDGAEQIVALKNKAEALAPKPGQLIGAHGGSFRALHPVRAGRGGVEAAEDIHQRGFARAGLADNGHKIAFFYAQSDVFEHMHAVFAAAEIAVDVVTFD